MVERRRYGSEVEKRLFKAVFALSGAGPGRYGEDTVSSEAYQKRQRSAKGPGSISAKSSRSGS